MFCQLKRQKYLGISKILDLLLFLMFTSLKKQFFKFVLYLNKKIYALYVYKILIKMEKNNKIKEKNNLFIMLLNGIKKFFFKKHIYLQV